MALKTLRDVCGMIKALSNRLVGACSKRVEQFKGNSGKEIRRRIINCREGSHVPRSPPARVILECQTFGVLFCSAVVSLFNLRFRVVALSAAGMALCGIGELWERPMVSVHENERNKNG